MSNKKTWLITGASSGIGYGIALAALKAGHNVIATARKPSIAASKHPEFEKLGGRWAALDVSVPEAQQVVEEIIQNEEERQRKGQAEGKIHWVIVNNAGIMDDGLVEDQSEAQIDNHLQVILYGAIRVWKGSIPTLRRHKEGTLITMGSIFAMAPFPETQLYSCLKSALSSLTDSYASVLRPLGIRCLILEPGLFRTALADNALRCDLPLTPAYTPRVQAWRDLVAACQANPKVMPGDPAKLGARVVEIVDDTGMGEGLLKSRDRRESEQNAEGGYEHDTLGALRVMLGPDCYTKWGEKMAALQENYRVMAQVARSTDHDDVVQDQNASRAGGAPGEDSGWAK